MNRRNGCAAWALLGLTFAPALAVPAPPSSRPSPAPNPRPAGIVASPRAPSPGAGLYSRRARRLAQSYLRLKILELRETDLDRAREVIERHLGADALLAPRPVPSPVSPSAARER